MANEEENKQNAEESQKEVDNRQDRTIDRMTAKLSQIENALEDEGLFSSGAEGADIVVDGKRQTARYKWARAADWQKKRLTHSVTLVVGLAVIFLGLTCSALYNDKIAEEDYWNYYLNEETPDMVEAVEEYGAPATHVKVAVYLNQIRSVDIKNSQFQAELTVGYSWKDDDTLDFSSAYTIGFYKGIINHARFSRKSSKTAIIINVSSIL